MRFLISTFAHFHGFGARGSSWPEFFLYGINSLLNVRARCMSLILRWSAAADPGLEPVSDIAAARNCGEVIEGSHLVVLSQSLEDSQIEGCATNAAAGKRETGELHLSGLAHDEFCFFGRFLAFNIVARSFSGPIGDLFQMLMLEDFFWRERIGIDSAACAQGFDFYKLLGQSLGETNCMVPGDRCVVTGDRLVIGQRVCHLVLLLRLRSRGTMIWAVCRAVPEAVKQGTAGEQALTGEIS